MAHTPLIIASYKSPTDAQTFSGELPQPPSSSSGTSSSSGGGGGGSGVDEKTAYLAELRVKAAKMQGEINTFLTRKMEEDNRAAAAIVGEAGGKCGGGGGGGGGDGPRKVLNEDREEDMYGEEDVEEDV